MLQNIRENLTGKLALVILGVIALSFVFVSGVSFTTIGSNYAAKVDGVDIGIAEFEIAYRDQVQANPQLAQLPDQFRGQLRSNLLEQLIQQQVIDNYLQDAGFATSDEQLSDLVRQIPEFQLDGKFDRETYENVLLSVGRNAAEFEASQRLALRRSQLQRAITGSSVVPPSSYRRFLNLALESRVMQTAEITAEMVEDEIEITPEMIQAFYDENTNLFNLPESVDLEYVEIRRDGVASGVAVTEEDLREFYEINKNRYQQDEQRRARHILILFDDDEAGAESVATELLTRIRGGEPFEDLAAEYSKDGGTASNGGDLGALTRTQLPDALGETVFAMQEGEISGPVKGDFGFHVVRLDEILESGPLPFEQVRASLLTELQDERAEGLFLALERKLSDALFDAGDIQSLAAAVGGEVQTAAGFVRGASEPFGGSQAAVDAIFEADVLDGSEMTDLIELDVNRTVVVAVNNYDAATRDSLENVTEQVRATLHNRLAEDLMADRARRVVDAISDGDDFATAADSVGAVVGEMTAITRNAADQDQAIVAAVFTAEKPSEDSPTVGNTRNSTGGYTVYSVNAVIPGQPQSIPVAERDAGKQQLLDQYGVGDFVAFVQALRTDADVIINEDALAAQDPFQ